MTKEDTWVSFFKAEPFSLTETDYKSWFERRNKRIERALSKFSYSQNQDAHGLSDIGLDLLISVSLSDDPEAPSVWDWHNMLSEFSNGKGLFLESPAAVANRSLYRDVAREISHQASRAFQAQSRSEVVESLCRYEIKLFELLSVNVTHRLAGSSN